jgi:Thrombospondin type 3 repeat
MKCVSTDIDNALSAAYQEGSKTVISTDIKTTVISDPELGWWLNMTYNKDFDNDTIINDNDNCPLKSNKDQKDTDKDLIGDVCDLDLNNKNPLLGDSDHDGVDDERDNCPFTRNPDQRDENSDGR